jgi:hypothetical protein
VTTRADGSRRIRACDARAAGITLFIDISDLLSGIF